MGGVLGDLGTGREWNCLVVLVYHGERRYVASSLDGGLGLDRLG